MFCKECGAEIPDDVKFCSESGAKLVDDTPVVQSESVESKSIKSEPSKSESVEKESFFKKNKKVLIGCCAGVVVIFLIFAFISIGSNQTDVDMELSSGIEKVLEDNDYKVSRSVKDGNVKLNGLYLNLTTDGKSDSDLVDVVIYPFDMLDEVASKFDLSPRQINGINGYGGYAQKMYTYEYLDNGNTVVIVAPSKDSPILETVVKDY